MSAVDFTSFLKLMVHKKASDLFITAGVPPSMKVHGRIARSRRTFAHAAAVARHGVERDDALAARGSSRRRTSASSPSASPAWAVSACRASTSATASARCCAASRRAFTVEELALPPVIKTLAMTKARHHHFVGATGNRQVDLAGGDDRPPQHELDRAISSPSRTRSGVHKHEGCIITQRELGIDTDSWDNALKNTLAPGAGRDPHRRGAHARDHGASRDQLRGNRPPVPVHPA